MVLNKHSLISRSKNVAERLFEGEMLIITPNDSKLHRLNKLGTFIWGKLHNKISLNEICNMISEAFEGYSEEKNFPEICGYLLELEDKKLITIERV